MICQSCNATNVDGAQLCKTCGADLDNKITRQSSAKQPTILDANFNDMIGRSISAKYRLDSKLGAGGMGTVYKATRLMIGDEVAVKILHSEQSDPKAGERFRREAQAAARLKHPNAVTIHDFGITDDGMQYLVMELVEGQSLRRIIKGQGPLTPSASVEIIDQVCDALDDAHRHGIIHRDIKPDNIIVNLSSAGLIVKVLDFGIAKLRDDTVSNLTQTGSILGTPHYMSPEQCLGEELDTRSDIYSVGVVLYEMLTGLVPFNSPTPAAVVVQQVTQPPPSLRALNASLSPAVESVVLHALEKHRASRPQTAGELANEFKSATRESGFRAAASTTPNTSSPNQSGWDGVQDSGSTPTVVLTDQTSGRRITNPAVIGATATQKSSKPRSLVILLILMSVIVLGLGGLAAWALLRNRQVSTPDTRPVRLTVSASSVRPPEVANSYEANKTLDGRLNTAWVEGVDGPGVGQWLRFEFDREVELRSLTISPGYFKTPVIWSINNRVAAAGLQFSDGSVQHVRFNDRMEQQEVQLGSVTTSWVKIVIEEVYFSKDQLDTAISEVSFGYGAGTVSNQPTPNAQNATSSGNNVDSVEARIVSGQMIGSSELIGMSKSDLQRLRNTIFARHGRVFNLPDLQQYFSTKPWYTPRPDYTDSDLTSTDKANLNLIIAVEKGAL